MTPGKNFLGGSGTHDDVPNDPLPIDEPGQELGPEIQWSWWVVGDEGSRMGQVPRDQVWIQHAIEHYRQTHGQFPYKLSVALSGRPNALAALDRIGQENIDYQLHPTRGYLLTFVRHGVNAGAGNGGNGSREVEVRVEDHESFLKNLIQYQEQGEG